jgi:hypothetical protein
LSDQEIIGPANPNVARMNVIQKSQRNKIVPHLPNEVWQKNDNRNRDSDPEPTTFQVAPRRRKDDPGDESRDEKDHRVFRHHTDAQDRADRQPPSRIVFTQQADEEVRCHHPPKKIEGDILEQCPH